MSTALTKEFTVYQDKQGQYILVTQPDKSLQRMYIKGYVQRELVSPELLQQQQDEKQQVRLQKQEEKLFDKSDRLPNLDQYQEMQKKQILTSQRKRFKMVDEKLAWKAKSRVNSYNKTYSPGGGKVDILDRKKLAPATRWKAASRIEARNRDYIPSYSEAHLLEQPQWNKNARVQHQYVRNKVVTTEDEDTNERRKWHNKARHIPQVEAEQKLEQNPEERSVSTQSVDWQVLPDINSSKGKANRGLSSSMTSRSEQNGMQSPASPLLPKINGVIYNSKTKKWIAMGNVTKSENSTPDLTPIGGIHNSNYRRRLHPLKLHSDPVINQRIKNYRNISKYRTFPSRSQSVASQSSTNSTYEQPSKSVIFDSENGLLWNTALKIEDEYGELKQYMNTTEQTPQDNDNTEMLSWRSTPQKEESQDAGAGERCMNSDHAIPVEDENSSTQENTHSSNRQEGGDTQML